MCKVKELNELHSLNNISEEDTIYISKHAFQRMKERQGWNKKAAIRMMKKVFDNGILSNNKTGYISLWIKQKVTFNENDDRNYIIYGDYIYIFIKHILLTVKHIPPKQTIIRLRNHMKKGTFIIQ